MFSTKNKIEMQPEKATTTTGNGTTLISTGTTLKGDVSSNGDIRIDGTVIGNINSTAKIVIGANGIVEGDIFGNQADITGKVSGNIRTKELMQLRGESIVTGNLYAGKLQVEPTATFNGQCHMGANIVDMNNNNEALGAIKKQNP